MEDKHQFAGFWKRVGAYLIDTIIVSLGIGLVSAIILFLLIFVVKTDFGDRVVRSIASILLYLGSFGITMLYHSLFESSAKQATPGKMALGIVVTDAAGRRITFLRALGRNFGRILSGLFFGLGYVICGFTARRQAIHDLVASTLVVNDNAPLRQLSGSGQGLINPGTP
ncbi:MAG: RDD family protein [Cyanobacteria bacterium SZAS TMP-1]|nr:RDD family protein [Cyanobacteria bacterium SZAS TMP-1]